MRLRWWVGVGHILCLWLNSLYLLTVVVYIYSMKLKELTEKQNDFYAMLRKFASKHQRMPTVKEASEEMDYASPSASSDKIERLVDAGILICKMVGGAKRYTFRDYRMVLIEINPKES